MARVRSSATRVSRRCFDAVELASRGPAAIQIVSDYEWGTGSGSKYSQGTIAGWTNMGTGGTAVADEVIGANRAKAGSRFDDIPYLLVHSASGQEFWNHVQYDVSVHLPLIGNLAPWWQHNGTWNHLVDWSTQSSGGHWIVLKGYLGNWTETTSTKITFDDSSGHWGGGTGTYTQRAVDVWYLIHDRSNSLVW